MNRFCVRVLFCIVAAVITGCASRPSAHPFFDKKISPDQHALVSALNRDSRVNKSNFFNPFNRNNWNTSISSIGPAGATTEAQFTKGSWGSLLVTPGSYMLQVMCSGQRIDVWVEVWVDVPLNDLTPTLEYGLECYGLSAYQARVQTHTRPRASSSRSAYSPGSRNSDQ
jgi:hypothetical protein